MGEKDPSSSVLILKYRVKVAQEIELEASGMRVYGGG